MTLPIHEKPASGVLCNALVADGTTPRAQSGAGGGAEPEIREVVRLTTSCWRDKRGLHIRRSLTTLKRQSSGHQILDEDCSMTSPDEVVSHIVNLNECKDGVYVVVTCNEWKDWETGHIEDYDYKLLPRAGQAEFEPLKRANDLRMSDAPPQPSDSPSACEARSTPCAGSETPT